jgi:leucyl aminopeptidase
MNIDVRPDNINEAPCNATVIFCYEDDLLPTGVAMTVNAASGRILKQMIDTGDIKGKTKEVHVIYVPDSGVIKRLILIGLGKKEDVDLEVIRSAYAIAAQKARAMKWKSLAILATALDTDGVNIEAASVAGAAVEGIKLGLYQFTQFKTEERENIHDLEEIIFYHSDKSTFPQVRNAAKEAEIVSDAVIFARNLVSMPSNLMTPKDMASEAIAMSSVRKRLTVTVLNECQMQELGMNALLGVTQGSREEAKFIIMEYKGGKTQARPVVLIGKGLTFDSGGISLKPAEGMEEMKTDMAGGAAVMGTVLAAADLKLPLNVIGLIPATENMPGGLAYKPGDILKTMSGLTVEVISTDAEGRLILADALTYAKRYNPSAVIDVATLTGACIVALGENVIGLMGKDDKLKDKLKDASASTGEKIWELPLFPEYYDPIKSDIADLKNVGGRPAGAITAGAFLSKFAVDFAWAHLDIAGPSWAKKDKAYIPKGATGIGVRLMTAFLKDWSIN